MERLIAPRAISELEYLRIEELADARHEFREGQIVAMAGDTYEHGIIANNLAGELRARLKGTPCQPLGSDVRVRIPEDGHYFYPDAMIVCGPPVFDPPDRRTAVSNPQVVIEVSSPSTEMDDRRETFRDYRRLNSLQEYILVSQDRPMVETFYRHPNGIWAIGPTYADLRQAVKFRTLEIEIPMREIYAGVTFPPAQAAQI